jgi:hypothetical protein
MSISWRSVEARPTVVHIEALRSEVDAFKSLVPPPFDVEFRFETSADGVRHYVGTAVVRQTPPPEWSLIIGDAVQNVCAALEYLFNEMTPRESRSTNLYFPIYTKLPMSDRDTKALGRLSQNHRTLVERLQPHHDPEPHLSRFKSSGFFRIRTSIGSSLPPRRMMADHQSWVGVTHANVDFTFLEYEHVKTGRQWCASPPRPRGCRRRCTFSRALDCNYRSRAFRTRAVALLALTESRQALGRGHALPLPLPPDPSSYTENDPAWGQASANLSGHYRATRPDLADLGGFGR